MAYLYLCASSPNEFRTKGRIFLKLSKNIIPLEITPPLKPMKFVVFLVNSHIKINTHIFIL